MRLLGDFSRHLTTRPSAPTCGPSSTTSPSSPTLRPPDNKLSILLRKPLACRPADLTVEKLAVSPPARSRVACRLPSQRSRRLRSRGQRYTTDWRTGIGRGGTRIPPLHLRAGGPLYVYRVALQDVERTGPVTPRTPPPCPVHQGVPPPASPP